MYGFISLYKISLYTYFLHRLYSLIVRFNFAWSFSSESSLIIVLFENRFESSSIDRTPDATVFVVRKMPETEFH